MNYRFKRKPVNLFGFLRGPAKGDCGYRNNTFGKLQNIYNFMSHIGCGSQVTYPKSF